jgi:hypothetical protein
MGPRTRPESDEESGFVGDNMHDTPEEAASGDILRNLERAVERLAFARACIIPFTLNAHGDLHQDAYHPLEVISNELNYIGFAPPPAEEADEAAA